MSTAPIQPEVAPQGTPSQPQFVAIAGTAGEVDFTAEMPEFSPDVQAKLRRAVDPSVVELRDQLVYVPWIHYQDVLVDAFGLGGYRMVPLGPPRVQGNVMTWHMALMVRPPGQPKFYYIKSVVGECGMHAKMTAGNAAEGAQSDALTKACKQLRIFNELFDPGWRRWWETEFKALYQREKPQRPGAEPPPKVAPRGTPQDSSPTIAESNAPGTSPPPVRTAKVGFQPAPAGREKPASVDTGEAATDEAYTAIGKEFRRLTWKRGYVRMWLSDFFGVDAHTALTADQAATAYALLSAVTSGKAPVECPAYVVLAAKFAAEGKTRS